MQLRPFALERFFAAYEFKVKIVLSASDPESLSLQELLALADDESLRLWHDLRLGYTESQGHPRLREAVSELYRRVEPDGVLIAAPEEAIYLAMQALLKPGDHVVITFPAYQSLYEVASSLGCRVTHWALRPEGGAWTLDLDELAASLSADTRLLVLNFPHNPTGYLPARELFEAAVALAAGRGIWVFSDEMYRFLEHDPAGRLPPVADVYERGISLSGLSKSFALPGLRIGWLATRDADLLAQVGRLKDYTTICASAPSEILALMALRARDTILARNLAIIRENLATAERFFAADRDRFEWLAPQAGSIAFPRLAGADTADRFCQRLLEATSVLLLPGSLFEYPSSHFRLGLGRRDFGAGLALLDGYLGSGGNGHG